jgi:tetratricopeptide (TPR) repeat protein
VVLAARSTEVPPNDELAFLLADLAREAVVERMMLRPLPPEEAARLLGTLLCDTDEAPCSRRDELLRRAGGVPFFLVSGAQGLRAGSDQAIPWDLAQTIRARVVLLPEPAQLLLRVAAVAGRIAPRSMLLAVGHRQGLTDDDAARGLDTACRAGLLEVVGNAARRERMSGAAPDVVVAADAVPPNTASKEDTTTEDATTDGPDADTAPIGVEALAAAHHGPVYTFTHDLIRDAVLDEIGAAQRAHLHGGVAAVLAETAAASHPKILADHYARAGEFELASIFAERAGDAAVGRLAFGDAREQYRIALEHGGPPARRAKLLVKAAEVLVVLTLYDTAMGALCSASALYGDLGQRGDPDAWEHQARTEARIGQAHAVRGTTFDGIGRLRAYIASWPNPEGAKGVQAALELALADLYFEVSWYQEELAAAERAAAYAHQAGDEPTAIRAETRRATAYMSLGRTVDGKALLESLIPRAEHVDPHILTHVLNNAADTAIETGNFGQASAFSKRAGDAARRAGDPVLTAYTQYRLGVLAYFEGHWNEAHNHIEKAIELTTELRDSARVASVLVGAGRLLMAEGKTERAEAYFARGTGHGQRAGDLHILRMADTVRAERELLEGRPGKARELLEKRGDRGGQREADVTEFMPLLAWAYLDLGEREEAERIAAESVARARDQQVALALLDAWRIQALVLSRCDGGVEAVRQLRRVALLCANMPYPYGEAKALYVHGLVLLREGELEAARARLGAARAILERLGEGLYAPHVERALAEANRG